MSFETIKTYQLDSFLDLSDRFNYFLQTAGEADLYAFCLYYYYQSRESEYVEKRSAYHNKAKQIITQLIKKNSKDGRYIELNAAILPPQNNPAYHTSATFRYVTRRIFNFEPYLWHVFTAEEWYCWPV
ncbi:MAG: hypothetical protein INR73_11100 [Williamsia sp.]|nr:hypothetical protein [Williamsia sp.]